MLSELKKRIPDGDMELLTAELTDMMKRINGGMEPWRAISDAMANDLPEIASDAREDTARRICETVNTFIARAEDAQPDLPERLRVLAESLDEKAGDDMLRAVAEFAQSAKSYAAYGRLTSVDERAIHDIETFDRDALLASIADNTRDGFCVSDTNEHLIDALRQAGDGSALEGANILRLEGERKRGIFACWSYLIWRQAGRGRVAGLEKDVTCEEAALFTCSTLNRALIGERERAGELSPEQAKAEYSRNDGAFVECFAAIVTAALTVAGTAAAVSLIMGALGAVVPVGAGVMCGVLAVSIMVMFGMQHVFEGCNGAIGWLVKGLRRIGGQPDNA